MASPSFLRPSLSIANQIVASRWAALLIVGVIASTLFTSSVNGAQVDLRLDIDYADGNSANGGTWSLVAKSDEQGVFALGVNLTSIDSAVQFELPSGTVNGTNAAGFSTLINDPGQNGRNLFVTQQVLPGTVAEQGVFYGVGTLTNGAPNSPGSPGGTNSIGPVLSSLSGTQNLPWASNDPLWATGFSVASGTFSAGDNPSFATSALAPSAILLTSLGTSGMAGELTNEVSFTALISSNLSLGVNVGDYNGDGMVDAADYTVWRDTLSDSVAAGTGADGNGNGTIDNADYGVWVTNYGLSAAFGTSSATASSVPEPNTLLIGFGLFLSSCVAEKRRQL